MKFKEVRYSRLRLAWELKKIEAHRAIKLHGLQGRLLITPLIPLAAVVSVVREGKDLESRHDEIMAYSDRYWSVNSW